MSQEHLVFISHSSIDAPIAQLICHRLEEAGIRCWIAPRDITHGDWAEQIMSGLTRSDVFVLVLGEHSIASEECVKEITQATKHCEYLIPFRVDRADLTPKLEYHLGPCHWLDASTPPIEQRVQDLIERIRHLSDEDAVYLNQRRQTLRSHPAYPRPLFLGRDDELAEIAEILPRERVLFLQGMGGIGKSEIAKSYAQKYETRYDTVVFLSYEGSILDLVTGDSLYIENFAPQDTDGETAEQFFARKMETLRRVSSPRTLLILDNYDVDDDPHFEDFANGPYHLLITTRNEPFDYEVLRIGPIADSATLHSLFAKAYGKPIPAGDAPLVDEMIGMVGGHTITVDLLARQMAASHRSAPQMLALLKEKGINLQLKDSVSGGGSHGARRRRGDEAGESAFDVITQLFGLSGLSPACEQILRYMAMVPISGISIGLFYDICQLDSYDDINELIDHSWVMLDDETDILSMHPVIADVVRAKLAPDTENCAVYIEGLHLEVGSLWFNNREDRARLWPLTAFIMQHYFVPTKKLWQAFLQMPANAWICARYAMSIEYGHRILECTKELFPEDVAKIGQAATILGGCYHNSGDDVHAQPYYEEGLECQKQAITEDSDDNQLDALSNAYQKVGRCAYLNGDFDLAKKCFDESLRISGGNDNRKSRGTYANALLETGRMYILMGEYEKALEYAKESDICYRKRDGDDNPNSACSLKDIGCCEMNLGHFDAARAALEESLRLNLMFNGRQNRQTFWTMEAMGDLDMMEGRTEDAQRTYQEIEALMEDSFGEGNPDLVAIRRKMGR